MFRAPRQLLVLIQFQLHIRKNYTIKRQETYTCTYFYCQQRPSTLNNDFKLKAQIDEQQMNDELPISIISHLTPAETNQC